MSEIEYHLSRVSLAIIPGYDDVITLLIPTVQKRDHLTRVKQARDALRIDNVKLRHHGGLVSHLDLLQDFEDQVDKVCM